MIIYYNLNHIMKQNQQYNIKKISLHITQTKLNDLYK